MRPKQVLVLCSSHKRVVKEVQDRMVADHLATMHAETGTMVCSERTRDLSNMYTLLRPVPNGLSQLVHHLKEHIKQQGLQAVTNLKGDSVSVCTTTAPMLGFEIYRFYLCGIMIALEMTNTRKGRRGIQASYMSTRYCMILIDHCVF